MRYGASIFMHLIRAMFSPILVKVRGSRHFVKLSVGAG